MGSCFPAYVDTISQDSLTLINALKSVFVSRLDDSYVTFKIPGMSWYQLYLHVEQTRPAKSCSI